MNQLHLPPNSLELKKILHNKVSFTVYSLLLAQDFSSDFEKFKYVGMLTNPEGFAKIEGLEDNSKTVSHSNKKYLSLDQRKSLVQKDLKESFGTEDILSILGVADEDEDDGIIQL